MITGQTDPTLGTHSHDFQALAAIDTVVFMMGRRNLQILTQALIANGRDAATPVTCIERATMHDQRVATGTLADIAANVQQRGMSSPMITVVGDVAALVDPELVIQSIQSERPELFASVA